MNSLQPKLEEAFSPQVLRQLWDAKIATSRTRGRDGLSAPRISPDRVDNLVESSSERFLAGDYVFRPYRQILRSKGARKIPRVLSIPGVEDRLILLGLSRYLRQWFAWIDSPRPQPLVIRVREALHGGSYTDFVRLDVENFYGSISHSSLLPRIEESGLPPIVVEAVMRAIKTPTLAGGEKPDDATDFDSGVPVGTSLANVLGEIALGEVDAIARAQESWAYFRYVDDILVLTKHGERGRSRDLIVDKLSAMGLKAHPKKSLGKSASGKLSQTSFEYLGYTFDPSSVSVSRDRRTRLTDHLARYVTALQRGLADGSADPVALRQKCEWWLSLRITGCYSKQSRRGWLAYYSQIDDLQVLHELDGVVRSLLRRLPPEHRFAPKSFVKAWTLLRTPSRDIAGYIPDFDQVWSEEAMRDALRRSGQHGSSLAGAELRSAFDRLIAGAVKDLEHDVWALS
ncbi:RNA-directed DNA polymerase [Curtobacterium sp. ME26]|uniref:RNA-directed DNA polymerase n=1 Tax=Curtobacterium sp. ME26 TaxID=2744254 RepID=UPI0015F74970|nr:RNA-directed DNA polymerase [Curtobacterium sp. ME26]